LSTSNIVKIRNNFIANRQFTSYNNKISCWLWAKRMLFSLKYAWKMTILSVLKGNNSYNSVYFLNHVGNAQIVHCILFEIWHGSQWIVVNWNCLVTCIRNQWNEYIHI
jgi:hypothetical protein